MVGEEVNEMQLAGWIGTTADRGAERARLGRHVVLDLPERRDARGAVLRRDRCRRLYAAAQYLRVWRPRRRHERAAPLAERPPERPTGLALGTGAQAPARS